MSSALSRDIVLRRLPRYQRSSAPTDTRCVARRTRRLPYYASRRCVPTDTSSCVARRLRRYQRSPAVPTIHHVDQRSLVVPTIHHVVNNTARPLTLLLLCATCCAVDNTLINNMVERACGCVPCVACKRMFKGDRGLSLHANHGCGNRWLQMGGTTYVKRWNEMRRTLPCTCAMK